MTLAEKVADLQNQGLAAARRVLDAIVRPTVVDTTATVARAAPVAERALRDLVVPAILTQQQWTNRASLGTLEDFIQNQLAARLKAAATDAEVVAALKLGELIRNQEALVRRKGGEPYAPAAGADTRNEAQPVPGPSWWESNFPGQTPPTLDEIRNLMGA